MAVRLSINAKKGKILAYYASCLPAFTSSIHFQHSLPAFTSSIHFQHSLPAQSPSGVFVLFSCFADIYG